MVLRKIFLPILVSLPLCALCQTDSLPGDWTNEEETFYCENAKDTLIRFSGGNLHESGGGFALKSGRNNVFYLRPLTEETATTYGVGPDVGQVGDIVTYKVINGAQVLVITSKDGLVHDLLKKMAPDEHLYDYYIHNKINFELAGKYLNKATGKFVTFYPHKPIAGGLTDTREYTFEEEYDYPTEVISFGKGKTYYYDRTSTGLDIYRAKSVNDGDSWEKGPRLMSLKLVSPPDYTFASTQFMTTGVLQYFSAAERRLIRNEIYARHGYIFKSTDLKDYFSKQDWYKPQFESVDDQLTDLERINVQLLEKAMPKP